MAKVVFMCRHYKNTCELPDEMKVSDAIKKFKHNPCSSKVTWFVEGTPAAEGTLIMDVKLGEIRGPGSMILIGKICDLVYDEASERSRSYCSIMKV